MKTLQSPLCPQALATVVADHMGGAMDHQSLSKAYSQFQAQLKDSLQSRVLPIGSLALGLPRHRALLFKTLADACELPCRMLRGAAIGVNPPATTSTVTTRMSAQRQSTAVQDPGRCLRVDMPYAARRCNRCVTPLPLPDHPGAHVLPNFHRLPDQGAGQPTVVRPFASALYDVR